MRNGFTLIEVLIYSALLAIFIGAAFAFISSILGTTDTLLEKNEVISNREFVERKIKWIFSGASEVLEPEPMSSSSKLKLNGSLANIYPAILSLEGNKLMLSVGGGASTTITNNRVRVTEFRVEHYSNNQSTSTIKLTFALESSIFDYLKTSTTIFYVIPQ